MLAGEMDASTARERIVIETRQYAKRQRTWFRHQLPAALVTHIDPRAAEWRDAVRRWFDDGRRA
jgi:tRNA dimethylallyltransferase